MGTDFEGVVLQKLYIFIMNSLQKNQEIEFLLHKIGLSDFEFFVRNY